MNKEMIINAYCKIRKIDNTIPDEVLDFMKDAALEKVDTLPIFERTVENPMNYAIRLAELEQSKKH